MLDDVACPDPAIIVEYARSTLAAEDVSGVETHLSRCPRCLQAFVEHPRPALSPSIPGCHIVKEIGRGRFGVVYKAWWLKDVPRLVALKVLSYAGWMERSRFERESAVLKRIDSPWIVKCFDSGEVGDALYFIMDLVDGVHLDKYLASADGSLNEKLIVFQRSQSEAISEQP